MKMEEKKLMRHRIAFRPETDDDLEFLYRVYASTRADEMKLVSWTDEQKEAFVRHQFTAQRAHYYGSYVDARFLLILEEGQPIGRLYLHQMPGDLRIVDIALLPEHRGRGIGAMLLRELIDDAGSRGDAVSIHVEIFNPALRLYERLGFELVETHGPNHLMMWRPAEGAPIS